MQITFQLDRARLRALGLVELADIDIVRGHRSHHAKALEVYRESQ